MFGTAQAWQTTGRAGQPRTMAVVGCRCACYRIFGERGKVGTTKIGYPSPSAMRRSGCRYQIATRNNMGYPYYVVETRFYVALRNASDWTHRCARHADGLKTTPCRLLATSL